MNHLYLSLQLINGKINLQLEIIYDGKCKYQYLIITLEIIYDNKGKYQYF